MTTRIGIFLFGGARSSIGPGKLVQRSWQDDSGNKRQAVEIQVTRRDLQFATAEVAKSTADGSPAHAGQVRYLVGIWGTSDKRTTSFREISRPTRGATP
jgi:single-stranded DNA-binding protein